MGIDDRENNSRRYGSYRKQRLPFLTFLVSLSMALFDMVGLGSFISTFGDLEPRKADGKDTDKYEVHIVRGDATNSAAAQQSKVHFCTSISGYSAGVESKEDAAIELAPYRVSVADLQFAPTGCTASHLVGTYETQLKSMGIPAFSQNNSGSEFELRHPRIICMVSDDGPDQRGSEKLICSMVAKQPCVLFCRFKCILHQLHLIVGKQLKRLNAYGYYSKLAMVINTWRSCGMPHKVYKTYVEKHGEKRARTVVKRLPPRALRGRWGSISASEAFLLDCGYNELPGVFASAVGADLGQCEGEEEDAGLVLDLTSVEACDVDSAVYRKVMGRWRRESVAAIQTKSFWIVLVIAHETKQPVDHFIRWVMSAEGAKNDDGELISHSHSSGKLPPLLFGKLDAFFAEFSDSVLNADAPQWELLKQLVQTEKTQKKRHEWVALLVCTALEAASELHRRVAAYFSEFPARLVWMVFSEPNEPCDVRRATADYFLTCHDLDEGFSKKLLSLYYEDFQLCKETGTICVALHSLLQVPRPFLSQEFGLFRKL